MNPILPWDLEDWLTDEGDRVVRRMVEKLPLTQAENLIYEVWLFDTEIRNGGVSQYFLNRGRAQWDSLCMLAVPTLPAFSDIIEDVNRVVDGEDDPFEAVIASDIDLDAVYLQNQLAIVAELRAAVQSAT